MSASSESTVPLLGFPNQCSPLWAKDGQAFANTKTTIPAINSRTSDATAPSTRSARSSLHGLRIRASLPSALAERDPLRGDDPLGLLVMADPLEELGDGRALGRLAAGDHPEVARPGVGAGLRGAQAALDA